LTTGVAVAASGSKKVTEFDYWLSQFVCLVPREEYRLVINDSVTGGYVLWLRRRARRSLHNDRRSYETSWSLQSLTTGNVVAASGFDEVTKFGYLTSRIVDLVPSDEKWLAVHDSVAGCRCFGYGAGLPLFTQLRMTCLLRQATVREP
jgi:hypothetical protein